MKYLKTFENSNDYTIGELMSIISYSNKKDSIKRVIDSFDNVNIFSQFGNTPLIMAVSYQNIIIIKELLENGADPNLPNKSPMFPIILASKGNREYCIEIIKMLTDAGAYWGERDHKGMYMFDHLNFENASILKKLYPDKYNEYILAKKIYKFNI